MQTIKIYTPYDCVIISNQGEEFLSANTHLILDKEEKLFVYPINKSMSYSFILDPAKSSPYYREILHNNEKHIFLLGGILSNSYQCQTYSYNGKPCHIKMGSERVIFEYEGGEREILLPFPAHKFSSGRQNHVLYTLCEGEENLLVALNLINKKTKTFQGKRIEIEKEGFFVENSHCITKYAFEKEGVVLKEVRPIRSPALPTISFFTFLRARDYQNAYALLSPALQEGLSQKDFKHFMGEITYFFPLEEDCVFALSNSQSKIFTLSFEEGKICDIDDE